MELLKIDAHVTKKEYLSVYAENLWKNLLICFCCPLIWTFAFYLVGDNTGFFKIILSVIVFTLIFSLSFLMTYILPYIRSSKEYISSKKYSQPFSIVFDDKEFQFLSEGSSAKYNYSDIVSIRENKLYI